MRVAYYESGNVKKWKSRLNNPIATNQFVDLFKSSKTKNTKTGEDGTIISSVVSTGNIEERTEIDGTDSYFSDMVLQFLPELPEGVDLFDKSKYIKLFKY